MLFMPRCRMEIKETGDYSKWAEPDTGLMTEHVYGNEKAVRSTAATRSNPRRSTGTTSTLDPCKNFNTGKCPYVRVPHNYPHTCSTCGKDHPVSEHKSH